MSRFRIVLTSFSLATVLFFVSARADEREDEIEKLREHANRLQTECLDYRHRTTNHGHVFLKTALDNRSEHRDSEHRIWFSGERLRFDRRHTQDDGSWSDWERFVVAGDRYIMIPEGEYEGLVAPVTEYEHKRGGVVGHFNLYHPRWLGMGEDGAAMLQHRPETRSLNPGFSGAIYGEVEEETLDGMRLLKVTRNMSYPPATPDGERIPGEFVMWLAPEAGGSLVRAEAREYAKYPKVISVENRLELFPGGDEGVWFPREIVYETRYGLRSPVRRAVCTILEAEFGTPPDDSVFTLAGMQLDKGKRISDRSGPGVLPVEMVSDGEKLIQTSGPAVNRHAPERQNGPSLILAIGSALLTVAGVFFLVRMLRSRTNP